MPIHVGDRVLVRTAGGDELPRRATTPVVSGLDFLVVWVCPEEEWIAAIEGDRAPEVVPWPAEAVRPSEETAA